MIHTHHRTARRAGPLLALAVALSAVAACSSGTPSTSDTSTGGNAATATDTSAPPASSAEHATGAITLQLWGSLDGINAVWEAYTTDFPDEAAGKTFKSQAGGSSDFESYEQFRLQLSSGQNIPDIVQLNVTAVPEFAEAGVLTDLTDIIGDKITNVLPSGQTLAMYNGQIIGFPIQINEKAWAYRTDMFDAAGIDVTQVKTMDDLIAAGKKLQEVYPDSYIWNLGPNLDEYVLNEVVSGNGSSYSTKEPCALTIATDQGLADAFQAFKTLRESGVVANIDNWTSEWETALADGTIASEVTSTWFAGTWAGYAPDLAGKIAWTEWPEIAGSVGGSSSGGVVLVIPKDAPNKEAAIEFLTRMTLTAEGNLSQLKLRDGWMPVVTEVVNDPAAASAFYGSSLMDEYKVAAANFKLFPYDPSYVKEQTVIHEQLVAYLASSESSPASFLQAAQDQLEAEVGCPYDV
jgi:ABC-type glycerol-3-phosphate transport system substrate-binding protein